MKADRPAFAAPGECSGSEFEETKTPTQSQKTRPNSSRRAALIVRDDAGRTIDEKHAAPFPGRHARYRLRMSLRIIGEVAT